MKTITFKKRLALFVAIIMVSTLWMSRPVTASAETTIVPAPAAAGSIVYFGHYPQSDLGTTQPTTGEDGTDWIAHEDIYYKSDTETTKGDTHYYKIEPIAWKVLENAAGELFILARDNLDAKPFHVDNEDVVWNTSTIRSWLNGYAASYNIGDEGSTDKGNGAWVG
jgi:hypothetical protein